MVLASVHCTGTGMKSIPAYHHAAGIFYHMKKVCFMPVCDLCTQETIQLIT